MYLDGDLHVGSTVIQIRYDGSFEAHLYGCMTEFQLRGTRNAEGDRINFLTLERETCRGEPFPHHDLPGMMRTTLGECILLVPGGDPRLLKQGYLGGFRVFSPGGRAEQRAFLDWWETVRPARYADRIPSE